ncbi:MAG TPA: hypothetical protein VNT55_02210 [Baekduia sp.]|nr:hypothetical protein [Baekduia sp.]
MRRLHHWILAGLAALIAALACAPASHACVLVATRLTDDQRVQDADVAFTGTVESVVAVPGGGTRGTVLVDRVVKGDVPARVDVITPLTSCGIGGLTAGERLGLLLSPDTPVPWGIGQPDLILPARLDALPLDSAFAPLAVAAIGARATRRAVQVHVRARRCTTLRPVLTETAGSVRVVVTAADGPRCTSGARADRCIALVAKKALGGRAVRPSGARRVATATRCSKQSS